MWVTSVVILPWSPLVNQVGGVQNGRRSTQGLFLSESSVSLHERWIPVIITPVVVFLGAHPLIKLTAGVGPNYEFTLCLEHVTLGSFPTEVSAALNRFMETVSYTAEVPVTSYPRVVLEIAKKIALVVHLSI